MHILSAIWYLVSWHENRSHIEEWAFQVMHKVIYWKQNVFVFALQYTLQPNILVFVCFILNTISKYTYNWINKLNRWYILNILEKKLSWHGFSENSLIAVNLHNFSASISRPSIFNICNTVHSLSEILPILILWPVDQ